ncbi:MAG TPA: enoyl-CoA hydratase-related protein [Candidatus Udaeobacter sp.]|jgi:Enoyl-CoA hydratase/carnithine racemase|nr:enoyl-CoA hydratase-related protein [Candidatus Udaeobacter sp.]
MNEFTHIKFQIEDRVARITFARAPLNVFNIAMMREVSEAIDRCAHRDVVAIVFDAAAGTRAFSAGVAVEEHLPDTVFQMLDSFHNIFRLLTQISKPTVAVVDGPALGGGCELVAGCDIVIASERARFGQPEIKLGVFPPVAAILLSRIVGEKKAREMILLGEMIDASEALRLGLVNYVVPSSELEHKTNSVLAKLRENSSSSLTMTHAALELGAAGGDLDSALEKLENFYLNELMKTEDAQEGVRAYMEKRKPVWRNR